MIIGGCRTDFLCDRDLFLCDRDLFEGGACRRSHRKGPKFQWTVIPGGIAESGDNSLLSRYFDAAVDTPWESRQIYVETLH